VLSLDFSPHGTAKAQALAAQRGVRLRTELADVTTWSWPPAAFDVVIAIFIQFATPAQRPVLFANMKRTLKPGGLLLMEGYRPKQIEYKTGGPPNPEHLYTRELLEQAFADFASLDIVEYDAVINEGAGHAGLSALIDLVGRK
jgi:cyclopropane fatty-acyl-phospholipid synthase-like methyltransferase